MLSHVRIHAHAFKIKEAHPLLESSAITKRYGRMLALDRVTLCLEPGHSYAMLGPNGSGKTTWMKLAADLLLPTSGTMLLNGKPVSKQTRGRVAYMSTENFLYPWMAVRDVGLYFRRFFPDYDLDLFKQSVAYMELRPVMKMRSLSSGMMAKLKVAATLARKAEVYLFDEPFNGIDLIARDDIASMILNRLTPQTVMVLSSHLVEELEAVTDRAVFMRGGKVLAVSGNEDLRQRGITMADAYREVYGMGGRLIE